MPLSATALEIIADLIRFPTISARSNRDLIAYVCEFLAAHDIPTRLFENEDGTKANLLATIGPADVPGIVLSGHSDVVPTEGQNWSHDPFSPWQAEGRLYGRGACDMKGFLGLVLAAAPRLAARPLARPVHIAISYDEEVGCAGVGSLVDHLATLETKPLIALIGEPTEMRIVTAHKGIRVIRTTLTGRAAHSSLPEAGANALVAAAEIVGFLSALSERLKSTRDDRFDPPYTTINIGRLTGGAAVNIIAERAEIDWEYRPLPGTDAETLLAEVTAFAEAEVLPKLQRGAGAAAAITFEPVAAAPALDTEGGEDAEAFLRRVLGANRAHAVSFTTEAGLFQSIAGIPAIVCGPGSIEQAHKPDEFVSLAQLEKAQGLIDAVCEAAESGGL
ncbi:MAG: acetylornithine deacetylase [Alphaproteobacteria bacterium]|nr:MAG: acetylornithine deacetylase [Alphaproteobacteria bacterium]